jgi:hypothetical protein
MGMVIVTDVRRVETISSTRLDPPRDAFASSVATVIIGRRSTPAATRPASRSRPVGGTAGGMSRRSNADPPDLGTRRPSAGRTDAVAGRTGPAVVGTDPPATAGRRKVRRGRSRRTKAVA